MLADEQPTSTAPVVVGGGSVGFSLALFLDHHGVPYTVMDDGLSSGRLPGGNTHTMEHFRQLGVAEQALGLPPDHLTEVAYFIRSNGLKLARLPLLSADGKRDAVARSAVHDQTPEPLHRVNQMCFERLLFDYVMTRLRVRLRFGWRATEVMRVLRSNVPGIPGRRRGVLVVTTP